MKKINAQAIVCVDGFETMVLTWWDFENPSLPADYTRERITRRAYALEMAIRYGKLHRCGIRSIWRTVKEVLRKDFEEMTVEVIYSEE